MIPSLNKFYPGKEKDPHYIEALQRHMTFFNTEGHFGGGPNLGLSLALEEAKSKNYDSIPGEVIVNIKTGLMGPLAGIGDTITWSTLMYLLIGLFLPLAKQGSVWGGIGPVACLTIIVFTIGYILTIRCYEYGYTFAENMLKSGIINIVIMSASVLGFVKKYIQLQEKAFNLYRDNPDESAQTVATELKIDKEESLKEMKELVWLSGKDQLKEQYLGTSNKKGDFVKTLKDTADFLVEQKAIDSAPDIDAFEKAVDPSFIEAASK